MNRLYPKQSAGWMLALFLMTLFPTAGLKAQCHNWSISAQMVSASTCAANGVFQVTVNGPDAPNLSNLQYGIPLTAGGFSVPLNNSSTLSSIPPGTYQVSAVASCGGTLVGKNTSIVVPGNYQSPQITVSTERGSLSCGAYGQVRISTLYGLAPYTTNVVSAPPGYAGPYSFVSAGSLVVSNLPAGNYNFQTVDACGNGTVPANAFVPSIAMPNATVATEPPSSAACDTVFANSPRFGTAIAGWAGYNNDTVIKVSAVISGGVSVPTPFYNLNQSIIPIPLAAGYSLKDCYGKTITYTLKDPCGGNMSVTQVIPYPSTVYEVNKNCNTNFTSKWRIKGLLCYPVIYTLQNSTTGAISGPYTINAPTFTTPLLPLGTYTLTYTTADGYISNTVFTAAPTIGNPYSVAIVDGSTCMHNYIGGFFFQSVDPVSNCTVELFSGPVGYSYSDVWNWGNSYTAAENQTPVLPNSRFFPAGNYVWKFTDNCGTYFVPVTVGPQHLYQYTVNPPLTKQTCQGMWVWPSGGATSNGQSVPIKFSMLKNGGQWTFPTGGGNSVWPVYVPGDSFLVTEPGTYTMLSGSFAVNEVDLITYPNYYTRTYTFTYAAVPLAADMNKTQGFVCNSSVPGQGKIFVTGKGGIPFTGPQPYYKYYLANMGQGAFGPYLANNATGAFSGFGGNANAQYDVKIVDSCGAFAVQRVTILDLQTTRLIGSSHYVACEGNEVHLSALYLPNATYTWTGPNGFTSSLRDPVISNVGPQHVGVYKVSITTPECMQTIADSSVLTMNGNPPKPLMTALCDPAPGILQITNPTAPYVYAWKRGRLLDITGFYATSFVPSPPPYTITPGNGTNSEWSSFAPMAIDSSTGCYTIGDSIIYSSDPTQPLIASIYSPHLKLCTGDTTILIAQGSTSNVQYQWFRNGAAIPGATSYTYITATPGNYKVSIKENVCRVDTSDEVTVAVVGPPAASITASSLQFCQGDSVTLQASTGVDYSYTWHKDNVTVPGAFSSSLKVGQGGTYYVTISNGACISNSPALTLTVNPAPTVNLTPVTLQYLCPGGSVAFSTTADPAFSYTWKKDGIVIPGATGNTYNATTSGAYSVVVATAGCPNVSAGPVPVIALPAGVNLGNDTLICTPVPLAIPLSVDPGFSSVLWSNGQTGNSVIAATPGVWWVQAVNACGTFTDTLRIRTVLEYDPQLPDDTLICNAANKVTFTVSAPLQNIEWSDGSTGTALQVTAPGVYWVRGQSPCGPISDTVRVSFCPPVIENILLPADSICEGDCIDLTPVTANHPLSHRWTLPGGTPSSSTEGAPRRVCYMESGVYPVTLEVSNAGGTVSYSTEIVVSGKPVPRFADTTATASYKSHVSLPACAGAQVVDWYIGDSLVCSDCDRLEVEARYFSTVYHCVVRNGNCLDSCIYKLRVVDIPHDVWLPDAFSPNGDGRNDLFHVLTDNPNVLVINLCVYNRWGQRMFISNMNNGGWDGTFSGSSVPQGTYFWTLRYKVLGSEEVYHQKGDVILVR